MRRTEVTSVPATMIQSATNERIDSTTDDEVKAKRKDAAQRENKHAMLLGHRPAKILFLSERSPEHAQISGEHRQQRADPARSSRPRRKAGADE